MTIDINELRAAVEAAGLNAISRDKVLELLDRLEAAEKERDFAKVEIARLHDDIHELTDERDALRAKVEQMEKQAPVGWLLDGDFYEVRQMSLYKDNEPLPGQTALYALPGAQPAPSVPDGWKLVPIEPTIAMCLAGDKPRLQIGDGTPTPAIYRAMIAAAPEAKP